jgi:hypothetical protein
VADDDAITPLELPEPPRRGTATTLECSVTGEWQTLDGTVRVGAESFVGDAVWSALVQEPATGSVTLVRARRGRREIERIELLCSVGDPARTVTFVTDRMGFAAAARHPVLLPHETTTELEIAWVDVRDGLVHRATRSVAVDDHPPTLFESTVDGVYVAFGDPQLMNPAVFFGRTQQEIAPVRWPLAAPHHGIQLLHLGAEHLPITVGAGVIATAQPATPWATLDSFRIAPPSATLSLAFACGAERLLVVPSDPGVDAALYSLDRRGMITGVVAAPSHLGSPPTPCSERALRETPRIALPGQLVAVTVRESEKSVIDLDSATAIVHGSPRAPCAAGWQTQRAQGGTDTAFISAPDPSNSWQLRTESPTDGAIRARLGGRVSYRPLECR